MGRTPKDTLTGDLFRDATRPSSVEHFEAPDPKRFPLNANRQRVRDVVLDDLRTSMSPLLITGYASLDQIIDFIPGLPLETNVRVLFGNEPFPSRRQSFRLRGRQLPHEVRDYWLREGISPRRSISQM